MRTSVFLEGIFVLGLFWSSVCYAECHLHSENAIMCESPANAIAAYEMYGMDFGLTHKDFNQKILHDAGCVGVAHKEDLPKFKIRQSGNSRYATPNGWLEFAEIYIWQPSSFDYAGVHLVNNWSGPHYVAINYLDGVCEKFVSENQKVPVITQQNMDQAPK